MIRSNPSGCCGVDCPYWDGMYIFVVPQVYPYTSMAGLETFSSFIFSKTLVLTFCSIALVVRAGEEGWSVIVVDEAPDSADIKEGRAVPVATSISQSLCLAPHQPKSESHFSRTYVESSWVEFSRTGAQLEDPPASHIPVSGVPLDSNLPLLRRTVIVVAGRLNRIRDDHPSVPKVVREQVPAFLGVRVRGYPQRDVPKSRRVVVNAGARSAVTVLRVVGEETRQSRGENVFGFGRAGERDRHARWEHRGGG